MKGQWVLITNFIFRDKKIEAYLREGKVFPLVTVTENAKVKTQALSRC